MKSSRGLVCASADAIASDRSRETKRPGKLIVNWLKFIVNWFYCKMSLYRINKFKILIFTLASKGSLLAWLCGAQYLAACWWKQEKIHEKLSFRYRLILGCLVAGLGTAEKMRYYSEDHSKMMSIPPWEYPPGFLLLSVQTVAWVLKPLLVWIWM